VGPPCAQAATSPAKPTGAQLQHSRHRPLADLDWLSRPPSWYGWSAGLSHLQALSLTPSCSCLPSKSQSLSFLTTLPNLPPLPSFSGSWNALPFRPSPLLFLAASQASRNLTLALPSSCLLFVSPLSLALVCRSVFVSVYLSVGPSVCPSVYLYLSRSVCLSVCLPACLSVCPSVYLSICLSVCLSTCLSVCLSVYPSRRLSFQVLVSHSLSLRLSPILTLTISLSRPQAITLQLISLLSFRDPRSFTLIPPQ
jgi:hypothetical protein